MIFFNIRSITPLLSAGEIIFFENAGGALTLRSALETSTKFAAIPDNQGRDNLASHTLNNTIKNAKSDLRILLNAQSGEFFMGESGTELLFRLIRNAVTVESTPPEIPKTTLSFFILSLISDHIFSSNVSGTLLM